jgi:hypothetical protein
MRVQRIRDPFKRYLQKRPFESFFRLNVCRARLSAARLARLCRDRALPAACKQRPGSGDRGTGRAANR